MERGLFIDLECCQLEKHGYNTCGDIFFSRKVKEEKRTVAVLSDGLGSGIKANILATMTASMALNFVIANEPLDRTAKIIMNTLPVDRERHISYATFSVVDIDYNNEVKILEYGNPPLFLIRENRVYNLNREDLNIGNSRIRGSIYQSSFHAREGDRLIVISDGISQSGIGGVNMPFGWAQEQIEEFLLKTIAENPQISSLDLSDKIVKKALSNDGLKAKDDSSCLVIYFRHPRKMVISSGPPFDPKKDRELATYLAEFQGCKVLSGGTTAQIISRELNRPINIDLPSFQNNLPPESKMEGFDLVTEGILTLGRLVTILENYHDNKEIENSAAGRLFKLILNHDLIEIIVGTKINEAHQDPSLPVELEIRRNVIKRINSLLEQEYLKEVKLRYI